MNHGLPVLDRAGGRDPRLLTKRIPASRKEIVSLVFIIKNTAFMVLVFYEKDMFERVTI